MTQQWGWGLYTVWGILLLFLLGWDQAVKMEAGYGW